MPGDLAITLDPERLDEGSAEERACFGALGVRFGTVWLTEGQDRIVNKVRRAPLLSAYHLAEWLAWNWWRLRWEPRSAGVDQRFAHHLPSIGEGYVWPNISVFSDGERVALTARPTQERPATMFRYLSDAVATVDATSFEYAVDSFVEQTRGLLRDTAVLPSNLDQVWNDVREERHDPVVSRLRRVEALLGQDPDQAETDTLAELMSSVEELGEGGVNEVAADHRRGGRLLTAAALRDDAERHGVDCRPEDTVGLRAPDLPGFGTVAAWRLGRDAAQALRIQERLGTGPLPTRSLSLLAALPDGAIAGRSVGPSVSFALDGSAGRGRVVLRSKWETGRRFEVARLLSDRIVAPQHGRFLVATRADTYRQKLQRSFAAELLAPFEAVDEMLAGDYSMERQQDVAAEFNVSELVIRTLLVSHRRLGPEDLYDGDDGSMVHA